MGGLLCCLKKPNDLQGSAKGSNGCSNNQPLYHSLHQKKKENYQDAKVTTARTLEEWIHSSPAMKPGYTNVKDFQIFRQFSKVSPVASSPSSVNAQHVYCRVPQSRTATHTHLCPSSIPSTLRIQAHFSRTERKMGVVPPSPLSRGNSLPILEEKKDVGRIQLDQGGEFLGFGKDLYDSTESSCISLDDSISVDEIGCTDDSSFTAWISQANLSFICG